MFTEDLSAFFVDTQGFSQSVTINGKTISVIFIDEFTLSDGIGAGVETSEPRITCIESQLPDVVHGKTVVIGAITYLVKGVEPDGTGIVDLVLEKQ